MNHFENHHIEDHFENQGNSPQHSSWRDVTRNSGAYHQRADIHPLGGEPSWQDFAHDSQELLLSNSWEDVLMGQHAAEDINLQMQQLKESSELMERQKQALSELMERQEQETHILNRPGEFDTSDPTKLANDHFAQIWSINALHARENDAMANRHASDKNTMQDRHEENWYDLYARAEEHAYQNVSDVQEVEKRPKDRVIEKVGQDVYNDFLAYRRYHYHDGRKRAFREELTKEMQEKLLLAKRQVDTEYERIRASNTDLRGKQAQRNKHLRAKASIARAYFDTKGIPLTYGEGETYNNALKAFLKKKSENPEALTRRAQGRPDEKWKAKMEAYIANPDGYQTTDDESKRSNPRTLPNPSKRPRRKRR